MAVTATQTQSQPYGCQAISPRVQFRSQPAGALAAPGEQGRCDGFPAAAGGAPERAQGHAAPMPWGPGEGRNKGCTNLPKS